MESLDKYTWGLGIEHEMHIFHKPLLNKKSNIKDFIIFDSESAVKRILQNKEDLDLNYDDYNFLKNVPFELSGRKCSGVSVIKPVPVMMPEFITNDPFCSIKSKHDIKNMTSDIVLNKNRFYKILMKDKITQKLVKKYGELSEYPFGMTRYLKCPIETKSSIYQFKKDKKGNDVILPEYNGSYHITFTLPYTEKTTEKEFINSHKNFCNQLQWLEPLLLTAYFTGDELAPGELKNRVRGSFRVMIIGWGNLAGTDVRLLDKGIGRYAKTPTYWRKKLYFKDVNKLKPCYKPSPMAIKEKAITSLSSNFRTFGSTDPNRPIHRESGAPISKPNGVEFRIFDHFSDTYIKSLVILVSLVAENSRLNKTRGYVYENEIWINEVHNIMKNGYKSELSEKYINLLRKKLNLKINIKSIIGIDVFNEVFRELYDKNRNGEWSKIFNSLNEKEDEFLNLPNINKRGWQFAFMLKLNRDKALLHKFNTLSDYLNNIKKIEFIDFHKAVIEIFGSNWEDDVVDIAYFYESISNIPIKKINLYRNINGTIKKLKILRELKKYDNFNQDIIDYFYISFYSYEDIYIMKK